MSSRRIHGVFPKAFLAAWGLLAAGASQAPGQAVLVDFGTGASYRGAGVSNPEPNGNYWNGYHSALANMIDISNRTTGIGMVFTTPYAVDSYNGPAGAVTNDPPSAAEIAGTVFDAAALGDLGATNAVFDYFATTNAGGTMKFTLGNLNPARRYNLSFFGSRKYPEGEQAGSPDSRTTVYAATDSNGAVQASVRLAVGVYAEHNSNRVATLAALQPDTASQIYIEIRGLTASNAGYLNCLKIEGYQPVPPAAEQTFLIDFGNSSSYNGSSVANPDLNGNHWSSVWNGDFYADLPDASGLAAAVDFGFDSAAGTDAYNGPGGNYDAAALGMLGGAADAVNDFFVSSRFQLQGLDPAKTYSLTFYGSHYYSADDMTVYSVYSDSSYTDRIAWVGLNVQVPGTLGAKNNSNTVAVITGLAPQAGNALYVAFEGRNGADGYLNAMQVDVHAAPPPGNVDIREFAMPAGLPALSFVGSNAVSYTLQYTTNLLAGGGWGDVLSGGIPVMAVGDGKTLATVSDPDPADSRRIYRLIRTPGGPSFR